LTQGVFLSFAQVEEAVVVEAASASPKERRSSLMIKPSILPVDWTLVFICFKSRWTFQKALVYI